MSIVKNVIVAAIIVSAARLTLAGQATNRGVLDEDIQITSTRSSRGASPSGDVIYQITNLYSSPLVAVSLATDCGPRSRRVSSDAALDHADPQVQGETRWIMSDPPECKVKLTSAIFADGRHDGDEDTIQWFLRRRGYALLQLQPIADLAKQEYLFEVTHQHSFDPSVIEKAIQERQSKLEKWPATGDLEKLKPTFERIGSQQEVLRHLLKYTLQLEALKNEPDYDDLKRTYVGILEEWSRVLQASAYPMRPQALRIPR